MIILSQWLCTGFDNYKRLDPVTLVSTRFVVIDAHLNAIFYLKVRRYERQ